MPVNRTPRVLVVEDEPGIADFLVQGLSAQGFRVSAVSTGGAALETARKESFDLVVLDLMLPDLDGLDVCRELRRNSDLSVIMLTARDLVGEKVKGLAAGADDYLAKPFAFDELLARVRSVLRRRPGWSDPVIRVGDLEVDTVRRQASRGGRLLDLTSREFDLLTLLAQHAGRPLRHEVIFERVWEDSDAEMDVVKVYINYLRQKLNASGDQDLIESLRGFGYVMKEPR